MSGRPCRQWIRSPGLDLGKSALQYLFAVPGRTGPPGREKGRAMMFSRRTAQLLHADHQASVAMVEALEGLLGRARRRAPELSDARVRQVLEDVAGAIQDEIGTHFEFEECELFTRLEAAGDAAIGAHLRAEHAALLPLGREVARLARTALERGFDDASWSRFRSLAGELAERMLMHIQKEEMALLPALDELLDEATDLELSQRHAGGQ